jgi:UDP-glucose 4-epimerase
LLAGPGCVKDLNLAHQRYTGLRRGEIVGRNATRSSGKVVMTSSAQRAVLVTGGAGYIGSHAVLALADAGRHVVVLDDLSTGFRWAVPPGVSFALGDIGDEALVGRLIAEYQVDAILHFAGSIIVPESVTDPLKYYRNNTANSRALIAAAIANGVKHFVFSSTAAVYGTPQDSLIDETSAQAPINPYGQSKLMTELMLRDVAKAYDFNFCALRYFNVAGADPAGRAGQATVGATHLIKIAVEAVCGKRQGVDIYGDDFPTPDGTGVRDYIHVSDLAQAHVHALDALGADPGRSHILNCGYGRGFSVLDVLDCVDRVAGVKLKRRMAPRRPGDPPALIADNARLLAQFPWRPKFDNLDIIVEHALRWEQTLDTRANLSRN